MGTAAPAVHQGRAQSAVHRAFDQRQAKADINEQATEQMLLLTKQMAEREGLTEQLKAQDQMLWVQRMNNIRNRAAEIVNNDLINV